MIVSYRITVFVDKTLNKGGQVVEQTRPGFGSSDGGSTDSQWHTCTKQ